MIAIVVTAAINGTTRILPFCDFISVAIVFNRFCSFFSTRVSVGMA